MPLVYRGKVFAGVINDLANIYYSDPSLDGRLGEAEAYLVELRASNVVSSPSATVSLESSNERVNWIVRNGTVISSAIIGTSVLYGAEQGTSSVGGRFARFGIKLSLLGSAYCELWVAARTGA